MDLKGVLAAVKDALIGKREEFHVIYRHFVSVNRLSEPLESSGKAPAQPENDTKTFFQDVLSMAYAAHLVMRLVCVTRSGITWEYVKDAA